MNTRELNFAYKVRHALNENLDNIPAPVTEKLASARKIAISRKKKGSPFAVLMPRHVFAGQVGGFFSAPLSWVNRMGLAIPLIVLAVGLVALYEFEQERRINDTAEMDAAVLADELPLSVYLDHGFNAYLAERDD
ncbi:MAG TPA: DUF3619 family protein [Noviherbaspirillum sp.]|nr:DUF3619 family protein [Noviherbaspirillum sp.]